MEETVQVLLDEGALVRNGATRLIRPISELKIPPTVQAILAARIDRLPRDAKDLLQTLSVIGRELPMSLISAVLPRPDEELADTLNQLQNGRIHLRAARGGRFRIRFQARPYAGGFLQLATTGTAQANSRANRRGARRSSTLPRSTTTSTNWLIITAAAEIRRRHSTISKAPVSARFGDSAYGEAMRNFTAALELLERTPSSPRAGPARIRAPNQPWSPR